VGYRCSVNDTCCTVTGDEDDEDGDPYCCEDGTAPWYM